MRSSCSNNGAAARLLLDAGANVNAENGRGASSITLAASQGHDDVLLVLLSHPEANPNFQVLRTNEYDLVLIA